MDLMFVNKTLIFLSNNVTVVGSIAFLFGIREEIQIKNYTTFEKGNNDIILPICSMQQLLAQNVLFQAVFC